MKRVLLPFPFAVVYTLLSIFSHHMQFRGCYADAEANGLYYASVPLQCSFFKKHEEPILQMFIQPHSTDLLIFHNDNKRRPPPSSSASGSSEMSGISSRLFESWTFHHVSLVQMKDRHRYSPVDANARRAYSNIHPSSQSRRADVSRKNEPQDCHYRAVQRRKARMDPRKEL